MLPLAELFVWFLLVPVPTLLLYGQLRLAQMERNGSRGAGRSESDVPPHGWLWFSLSEVSERQFVSMMNLNLPGALIGAPVSVPAVSYLEKHLDIYPIRVWQALTLPFFCIPAWWFVGAGMEGLLARKRLHLALRVIGSLLCCVCIAFAIGILTAPAADSKDLLPFLPGAVLWAVAFGMFPLNWVLTRNVKAAT
jgi:hypothetical protein